MRRNVLILGLSVAFASVGAWGQDQAPNAAAMTGTTHGEVYCSGMVTTQAVPTSIQVISGEQSDSKLTFSKGDYIYINKGCSQGVKPGDEFSVMRRIDDDTMIPWFTMQDKLLHAMGQAWADEGRIKVLIAAKDVSTAQITDSCDFMLRGDVVVPFAERPVPELKSEKDFDHFAPPSGKPKAMVVVGKNFEIQSGDHDIVYVNLGSAQGVKVGDYFRIFRYQGNRSELAFQTPDVATQIYGYGSAPNHYKWSDLPREILGEGIVLRASPNSSTVLITISLREIYEGDYCEVE